MCGIPGTLGCRDSGLSKSHEFQEELYWLMSTPFAMEFLLFLPFSWCTFYTWHLSACLSIPLLTVLSHSVTQSICPAGFSITGPWHGSTCLFQLFALMNNMKSPISRAQIKHNIHCHKHKRDWCEADYTSFSGCSSDSIDDITKN